MNATAEKTIKIPKQLFRGGSASVDPETKALRLSISSDEPYERYDWFEDESYFEVLDHSPGGPDLRRLKGGAALLWNHDRDVMLGTLSNPKLENGRCYVDARMSNASDVESYRVKVEEGILKDTSIGYQITSDGEKVGMKDGKPIYKFKFEVFEASLVSVPADPTVGVGRQRSEEPKDGFQEISIRSNISVANSKTPLHERNSYMNAADISPEQAAADLEKAKKEAATSGVAAYKAKCKEITDYVGALKNPAWQKAAEKVAKKHLALDDPDFTAFLKEANLDFNSDVQVDPPDAEQHRSTQHRAERLGAGEEFVKSKQFEAFIKGRGQGRVCGIDLPGLSFLGLRGKVDHSRRIAISEKTFKERYERAGFTSSDLSAVNIQVLPGILELGVQKQTVLDLIAPGTTGAASVRYARENGFGTVNGVAVTAGSMPRAQTVGERGIKPNWDPDLSTETADVKKIATTTKVPDEFMADFAAAQSYINNRLPYMVDIEADYQVLYGDGLGNNIEGIFSMSGVQTRAILATDDSTVAASLKKGITDIQVGSFFEPTGFVMHPYDWETASLLKDTTGRFLAGGPFYIPLTNGAYMELNTLWGKPVVTTIAATYQQPLLGAWKLGAQYFLREGMRIEMTNSNEDDFKRNLICLRAEERLALAVYRPVAFLAFTGFPART